MNSQHRGSRSARRGGLVIALVAGAGALATSPGVAHARVVQDERYGAELTWNAAVRLLRVDMGFAIVERDREAGFILFTYQDSGRSTPGSLEIVPARVDGVAGCRIIVSLPQMPTYAERHILTQLGRKLRTEYGEPPAPAPAAPPNGSRDPSPRPDGNEQPGGGGNGNGNGSAGGGGNGNGGGGSSGNGAARPGDQPAGPARPPDGRG